MPISDFRIEKFLGKGSYGAAFRARRLKDGKTYAVKEMNVKQMKAREKQDTLNEIRILASVYHPNILAYYETFIEEGKMYIVTELAELGDLEQEIKVYRGQRRHIPEDRVWSVLIQILVGLRALHAKHILHRDLKCSNIFKFRNPDDDRLPVYKVADFGVSRVLKLDTDMAKTSIGTPYYISPEIWRQAPYNEKTDVFSLGCLIYEMCAFKHPFEGRDIKDLAKNVLRGRYAPLPEFYSSELRKMVAALMLQSPDKRPSVAQLLESTPIRSREGLCPTTLREDLLPGLDSLLYSDAGAPGAPDMLKTIRLDSNIMRIMNSVGGVPRGTIANRPPSVQNARAQNAGAGLPLPSPAYTKRSMWDALSQWHLRGAQGEPPRARSTIATHAARGEEDTELVVPLNPEENTVPPRVAAKAPAQSNGPAPFKAPARRPSAAVRPVSRPVSGAAAEAAGTAASKLAAVPAPKPVSVPAPRLAVGAPRPPSTRVVVAARRSASTAAASNVPRRSTAVRPYRPVAAVAPQRRAVK